MEKTAIDILWVLLGAALVFLMQAGFLCLETGLTRSKNNINVAIKNLADFAVTTLLFWLVGFAFMFGATANGWLGLDLFAPDLGSDMWTATFFIFQVMFCGTAMTIVSGGIAERVRFGGYMIVVVLVTLLIYPLFGHWAWHGLNVGQATGWLAQLGYVDFAGSSVVHSVGGWVTLAMLLLIGPRYGRFPQNAPPQKIPGSSTPLAGLGVMLLFIGWLGFNGGSTLAFNNQIGRIISNTLLAGSAGLTCGLALGWLFYRRISVSLAFNGVLAGAVAITANAHVVSSFASLIIGLVGTLFMAATDWLLLRWKIDDAVGAVPVHLGAGIWGVLAVGIFGQPELLQTGLSRGAQIGVQALGLVVCFVWAFGLTYLLLRIINRFYTFRVSLESERIGLNVSEHDASTELLNLFNVMDAQAQTGDLRLRVPVEPFTEVGQIAQRYNQVMASLEEAVSQTNIIVAAASDGIVTFAQENWAILSMNPSAEAIFGRAAGQMIGQSFQALLDDSLSPEQLARASQYQQRVGKRADGTTFPLETAVSQTHIAEKPVYVALVRDITVRKQAEEALKQARDRALEASRLKSEFLAIVSHELRTPINAIMGNAEMMEEGLYGDVSAKQRSALRQIVQSSEHLTGLVNNMIDQAQLEAGTIQLQAEPFSPQSVAEEVEFSLGVMAAAKGLVLAVQVDPSLPNVVVGDEARVRQVFMSLVQNGIRYTAEGSVTIVLAGSGDQWSFQVVDTGPGIPEAAQAHIFDAFKQVQSPFTRDQGGIGLGLSIARRLVTKMGGTLTLQSRPGQGSTFTVTLPRQIPLAD
ncbi:MAG: ammonium transporter [Ardenticatenaceae bacterium]|nr:ammonium transporter [Ardenticatenaceae bacterium]